MNIFDTLLKSFSGGPEIIGLIILSLGIFWILGHYTVIIFKWLLEEIYPKLNKNKSKEVESLNFNQMFEEHFREKMIILIEEQIKELKNYNKIFNENYHKNVQNIFNELIEEKENKTMSTVFGIYEKITELRERYAGKMATREDIEKISKEIASLEKEISILKQKINQK